MLKLTCVVENTSTFASEFSAEHGLAIFIEYRDSKILFDTGKSHCNGFDASCKLKNEFKNKFMILESGKEIVIP
jgi:metal-dependent hydrolase (beta-lactamase superfamily II)